MPKLSRNILISVFILGIFLFTLPGKVLADTDPQSATVSASATVPVIEPSVNDTTPPTTPILISPSDGTHTSDNTPEFIWTMSTDPNGNYVIYNLYINGVATYLGISNVGNSAGNGYTARIDGSQIRLTPTNAFNDGSYTWFVTASDGSGNTSYSTSWSFVVDTIAPPLSLVDLDTYHNPEITAGTNFDIDGPKNITFTLLSDPNISVQINLSSDSLSYQLTGQTSPDGLSYLDQYLAVGVYTVSILAIDKAGNTTFLPDFTITIKQARFEITLPTEPGASSTPIVSIPYTPINISSLPATIASIESRLPLLYLLLLLLAVLLLLLLIYLWKRRFNLVLLDKNNKPIETATVYHSVPSESSSLNKVLLTKSDPIMYKLRKPDRGRLYIRNLARYSTLTVRLEDATYILSFSRVERVNVVVLG